MDKILKVAKKLKNFTLDDLIIMGDLDENLAIAALKTLIIEGKIKQAGKYFEHVECLASQENYKIINKNIVAKKSEITTQEAVEVFLGNIKYKVKPRTFGTYKSLFNSHIIPFFKSKMLKNIIIADIEDFKNELMLKKLCDKKIKNTLALLNQIIKHFQNEGWVERTCVFEVKRLEKETKREVQILTKKQVTELFSILEKDYKYLIPVVKKVMIEKMKLADVLKNEMPHLSCRRVRKDFFKIKQKLGLENYIFDDLMLSGFKNA